MVEVVGDNLGLLEKVWFRVEMIAVDIIGSMVREEADIPILVITTSTGSTWSLVSVVRKRGGVL